MDFLGFVFSPQGIVDLLALGLGSGATVGVFFVVMTLMYGRR